MFYFESTCLCSMGAAFFGHITQLKDLTSCVFVTAGASEFSLHIDDTTEWRRWQWDWDLQLYREFFRYKGLRTIKEILNIETPVALAFCVDFSRCYDFNCSLSFCYVFIIMQSSLYKSSKQMKLEILLKPWIRLLLVVLVSRLSLLLRPTC